MHSCNIQNHLSRIGNNHTGLHASFFEIGFVCVALVVLGPLWLYIEFEARLMG